MKREEKKQLNRRRMIEAAVHLFSVKPFEDVSMRDIARHADVSPALIYKYFDDQQHLYIEAMKGEAQKLIQRLESNYELDELVDQYIRFMFTDDVLYQMMAYFMLEGGGRPRVFPTLREISQLMSLFEQALLPLFPTDSKREAQLLFATLNGLLITYKNYPSLTNDQTLNLILSLSERYITNLQPK